MTMPQNTSPDYAASTFSEATAYSYDKAAPNTKRRSLRQRVKSALKDIGKSPFEYDDDNKHKQAAAWVTSLPPSRI